MTIPMRRFILSAMVAAVAAVLVSTGNAGLRAHATTAHPTVYVMYAMNCTFTLQDDAGNQVTSIPPGAYQVEVRTPIVFGTMPVTPGMSQNDWTACKGEPKFQLQGPGVDIFTTMTAGCESDKIFTATFQPSASYLAQDLNQPSVARGSFTTLASGAPTSPTATYGGGKGKAETPGDFVGSEALKGTLNALVNTDGTTTLKIDGKNVSKLKSGYYKFAIADRGAKVGLSLIGPKWTKPKILSSVAFKGNHSVTLALTAGTWTYYTSPKSIHTIRVS